MRPQHEGRNSFRRQLGVLTHWALALVACACFPTPALCRADDQDELRRTRMLEQMRALAEGTNVRFENGDRQPELVPRPVFRYDDQPRRFLDATMWVWTDA